MPESEESRWRAVWRALPGVGKALSAVIGTAAALIAVLAGLGVLGGNGSTSNTVPRPVSQTVTGATENVAASPDKPVVVTLLQNHVYITRGFVTPKGFVIATAESANPGFVASWTDSRGDHQAGVTVHDQAGSVVPVAVELQVLGSAQPPRINFDTRNASTLRKGDPVTAYYGPGRESPGHVEGVGVSEKVAGYGRLSGLLLTDRISNGTGGVPVLDAHGKMVAMIFAEGPGVTLSVPIEQLFNQFPDAF